MTKKSFFGPFNVLVFDSIKKVKKLDMFPEWNRIAPELERFGYLLYREIIIKYLKDNI